MLDFCSNVTVVLLLDVAHVHTLAGKEEVVIPVERGIKNRKVTLFLQLL